MDGYAKLASLMGVYPEVGIVRRFGTLSLQNILHLQAELVYLEDKFNECVLENLSSDDVNRKTLSKNWFALAHYNGGNEKQWVIVRRIRAVLKEYGDALLQQKELYQLQTPNPRDLAFLQEWMKRPSMGCVYLLGLDSNLWEEPDMKDLVTLAPQQRDSMFSTWIANSLIYTYHKLIGWLFRKPGTAQYEGNTVYYSQEGILRIASLAVLSLSSLLPITAIIALYTVISMPIRLAMVAVFTVCFTLCLGIFTNARSIDIFAATTAFAAVQVVFIGTNGNATS